MFIESDFRSQMAERDNAPFLAEFASRVVVSVNLQVQISSVIKRSGQVRYIESNLLPDEKIIYKS